MPTDRRATTSAAHRDAETASTRFTRDDDAARETFALVATRAAPTDARRATRTERERDLNFKSSRRAER
jgi:hypothetical protein